MFFRRWSRPDNTFVCPHIVKFNIMNETHSCVDNILCFLVQFFFRWIFFCFGHRKLMFNLNYIEHQMRVIQGYFEETLSAYKIADKKTPNRHWFLLKKIQTFPRRNLTTFCKRLNWTFIRSVWALRADKI